MRRLPAALAALLLLLAGGAKAEEIRRFESSIALERSGRFTVEERISYDFGDAARHGIFRVIPVRYERPWKGEYRIGLELESASDGEGHALPTRVERSGSSVRIRIGDPDRTVTGRHLYVIRYRVDRALLFLDDHDELYWNVTGDEWEVPIDATEVRVVLPSAGGAELGAKCFTGARGSTRSDCAIELSGGAVGVRAGPLAPREGLTLAVALPKGLIEEPSGLRRLVDAILARGLLWLLLPLCVGGLMLQLWRRRGRDAPGRASIPVAYEPPAGLTPAEVGTVLDESADLDDVTATLLDLAIRGQLEIEEIESHRFLFFSNRDYRLRRLDAPGADLRGHERKLLSALFAGGDEVLVSELRNHFHVHLPSIRDALYEEVTGRDGCFPARPDRLRTGWTLAGGAIGIAALPALAIGHFSLAPALALGATGLIVALFGRAMPRRTREGRRVYEEILGFREFVARVDADRLERMGGRSAERFEHVLPYAVVLGVADAWADAFAGIYSQPPRWFRAADSGRAFQPRMFVADVGRSLDTIGKTMASQPSGSGSSGMGGGGFSGGGFGGGGGGSW
jgi:Predicted membrane protein (DUF2207) C-terminal domain/Predicted membrane protein (DUF2207) N-terminal domain